MVGRKIEMKKIENVDKRRVTFTKRRDGLFKKANQLAILCDAEVAVIIFSITGKLFEFSSSGMEHILSRYKLVDPSEAASAEQKPEKQESIELNILKEEIAKLTLTQLRLLGRDLNGLGLKELQILDQKLNEGLTSVKEKKEQLQKEQLEHSKMQEHRVRVENEALRRQNQQLQGFFPSFARLGPAGLAYYPLERNNSVVQHGAVSSDTAKNFSNEKVNT